MKNKALIITDLEGISGICQIDQIMNREVPEYSESLRLLMADVNTAVQAVFDAGADGVYVWDGHGTGYNFPENTLDPRAKRIFESDMMSIIPDVDAVIQIGAHAMAGTMTAFLDHTLSSVKIHNYYYNNEAFGEQEIVAAFTGFFGIPCVAVSGDTAACLEAKRFFPGVRIAIVKTAIERNTAICIPEQDARVMIYTAVKDGYTHRSEISPFILQLPYTITVEYNRADYCDEVCAEKPYVKRLDARTVTATKNDVSGYYGIWL